MDMQMFIQKDKITFQPCPRPAERVPPPPVTIVEQWVELSHPTTSGIQQKLEADGYRLSWVGASRLAGLEYQGWEMVIEKDRHGRLASFHVRTKPENMVLIKTSQPDLGLLTNNPAWKNAPGLVSCTVSQDGRQLVFAFDGPTPALAFLFHMSRDRSVIRCAMDPGRVDTVLGSLTEDGNRILREQHLK